MSYSPSSAINWPVTIMAAAVALALGFGAAHWLQAAKAPAAPAAAPTAPTAPAAKPANGDGAIAEVKIPAAYLASAGIAVEAVGNGGMRGEILAAGVVAAAPNSEALVLARASGNITRINRQLGDTVKAGEALAQVDSMEAAAMAAERSVTAARLALARQTAARESALFEQGVTPRQDMEAAQAALAVAESEAQRAAAVARAAHVGADGKSVTVVSPIAGKLTVQLGTLGGFVQPQTELFRVAGSAAGQLQVEASVSAADVRRIAAGDSATLITSSGATLPATVRAVTPTVGGNTRAATVLLTPQADVQAAALVGGDGVQVRLHVKDGGAGIVVPEDAVQNIEGRDVLFVRTADGFRARPVLVGARSGGAAQIVSGVTAGEQVATRNAFLVKADMIKNAEEE
jgi:cobalt-zinc-cadmium efflux system membrane fusion protein